MYNQKKYNMFSNKKEDEEKNSTRIKEMKKIKMIQEKKENNFDVY